VVTWGFDTQVVATVASGSTSELPRCNRVESGTLVQPRHRSRTKAMLTKLWLTEPLIVRILLLGLLTVVTTAIVRIARLGGRLYSYRGDPISASKVLKGEVDPKAFAQYALARCAPGDSALDQRTVNGLLADLASTDDARYSLGAAEGRFLYHCELSRVDLKSIKTAALLVLFLSIAMVAFGTLPIYAVNCNNNSLPHALCVLESVDQVLETFGFGISLCAGLYFISGLLERKLGNRIAEWKYFFERSNGELDRTRA
jgi:hypothetical protein